MPAAMSIAGDAGPKVPCSFANNFWGREDAGVDPLLTRMVSGKTTNDEIRSFYSARAAIEEDYARKLLQLSRKPLGSVEQGTLRAGLDVARGETEAMGKSHALISQQMRSECEEPLAAFASGMKERRKIVHNGIEKLLKTKQSQTAHVNKCRDKYEQDCLRIKGYLAQGHMVMGQEERKNKAKLEKTQINMASNSNEYESAVKVLEETTGRWNKEWRAACDKFQDLEEERLDFTKNSLWAFVNIASTVCVTDDESCEKIRLALEKCEVEKDISSFIKLCGTGQVIPDPPKYINFCRGDVDSASEVSQDDDDYTVAQFARTTNPAFRSHSSQPAAVTEPEAVQRYSAEPEEAQPEEHITPVKANSGRPAPLNYRSADPNVPPDYSPSQHGPVSSVPHNQYPMEGMTQFCRADGPSRADTVPSSVGDRPSSRDDHSEYSNPSSFTSAEPMSGKTSPVKQAPINGVGLPGMASPEKSVQKKRSGFFSNSPFRRKSKKEKESDVQKRSTWNPASTSRINLNGSDISTSSAQSSPTKNSGRNLFNRNAANMAPEGEEPADPRASFQLNVGNNVFDVGNPDSHQSTPRASSNHRPGRFNQPPNPAGSDVSKDPIAQALADLKSSSNGGFPSKQASTRQAVDRYHGVKSPAPDFQPSDRPGLSAEGRERLHAQGRTPPPAYDLGGPTPSAAPSSHARSQSSVLGVPQPAHTRKEMLDRSKQWGSGPPTTQNTPSRPASRNAMADGRRSPGPGMVPRAASPQPGYGGAPQMRARSPGPGMMQGQPQSYQRAASPNPYANAGSRQRAQSNVRQGSGMEMQLSSQDVARYGDGGSGRSRAQMNRPGSSYGDYHQPQGNMGRTRSKSMGPPPGRAPQVLYYARAMYSYTAAIPEELTFAKGDILSVVRLQDDGWWEAEVRESAKGSRIGGLGLVPSNYLQRC